MIGVGLIGFGFAGQSFHAPVISAVEGLELKRVMRHSKTALTGHFASIPMSVNADDLLRDKSIGLIVVATPNVTHFPLAKAALEAGKHVVIDKPFATTAAEAEELVEIAKRNGKLLTVYHNRRHDGDFLTLRDLLRSGVLGRIVRLESRIDRFRPELRAGAWREDAGPGAGVLFDLAPHLIDQALLLFGDPKSLTADVRIEREGAVVDDAFDITLHYPQMCVKLGATMLGAIAGPRFALHGVDGSYVKFGGDPQEALLRAGSLPGGDAWGAEHEAHWGVVSRVEGGTLTERRLPTKNGDYRRFYDNVRDAVLGRAELEVQPEAALQVMRLLEAAVESSRTGKTIPISA